MRVKNSSERIKDQPRQSSAPHPPGAQQASDSPGNMVARVAVNYVKRRVISTVFILLMVPGLFCGIGIFEARRFVSLDNIWWFQILCGAGIIVNIVLLAFGILWFNKKFGEQVL